MKKVGLLVLTTAAAVISTGSFATQQPSLYYKGDAQAAAVKPVEKEKMYEFTGNFDITSNYVFRGLSQSSNLPAFQGGLTYLLTKPGIYFNIWGSNVYQQYDTEDADGNVTTSTATVEIDTGIGIRNTIADVFDYDISVVRYNYPKAQDLEYNELLLNFAWKFLFAKFGYSNDVWGSGHSGTYYSGGVQFDVPERFVYFSDVSFCGSIGHYSLPRSQSLFSYNDYSLALNKKLNNYTFTVQWTNTDGRNEAGTLDDAHLIGTVLVDF